MAKNGRTACKCGTATQTASRDEATSAPCPDCGVVGKAVRARTVAVHAREGHQPNGCVYRFCETPDCEIVYYGAPGVAPYRKEDLATRVGVKETDDPIPVCYCFSFTEREVIEDAIAHRRSTIRDYIKQKVRDGECACETKNPSGRCCLGNVGRAIKKASTLGSAAAQAAI